MDQDDQGSARTAGQPSIYRAVIDDVIAAIRCPAFDEFDIAPEVLDELQHFSLKWETKVIASRVAEFDAGHAQAGAAHARATPSPSSPPRTPSRPSPAPQTDVPSASSEEDEDDDEPAYAPQSKHPSLPQPKPKPKDPEEEEVDEKAINSGHEERGRGRGTQAEAPGIYGCTDGNVQNTGFRIGHTTAYAGGLQAAPETDIVFCTYDHKVARVKNKWKCVLKDGVIHTNGKDYLF
ncbi:transcription factor IIA, alpha/beta subunit-domain-containing protein [Mycena epipterygia]|nr:transcription factor IIA, alpha/beta subunit-domain-containing protein [Mycena epipterygia]